MGQFKRRSFLAFLGAVPLTYTLARPFSAHANISESPDESVDPWLEINLQNMAWNLSQIRKRVGNRIIMPVLKCNAYGHGLVEIARFLEKQGIRYMAVGKAQEAITLREKGIKSEILNFGPFSRKEAEEIVRRNISQSVYSEAVSALAEAARKWNKPAKVHIKIDTGLGRVGVPCLQALAFMEKVASMPGIKIAGVFTTLIEDREFDEIQIQRFLQVCAEAEKKGISPGLRHAASSAGISTFPASFLDMVRPGSSVYGIETLANLDLRPVMALKTRVILVKKLHPGDSVSYHRKFTAEKEIQLAILPIGYSDGYPWQAVEKAEVLIRGKRWPIVTAATANHSYVNVTGADGIKAGDEVVLFGFQNEAKITIEELANWAGSSSYKIAIGTNPLLPRKYMPA